MSRVLWTGALQSHGKLMVAKASATASGFMTLAGNPSREGVSTAYTDRARPSRCRSLGDKVRHDRASPSSDQGPPLPLVTVLV